MQHQRTTQLLRGQDYERLWDRVSPGLRKIAQQVLRGDRRVELLSRTILAHEAFIQLLILSSSEWTDRHHFFRTARMAMSHCVIDHTRSMNRLKRGGRWTRTTLEDHNEPCSRSLLIDQIAVREALQAFATVDPIGRQVVVLHVYEGLTFKVVAERMGICERKVLKHWSGALTWLYDKLVREPERALTH